MDVISDSTFKRSEGGILVAGFVLNFRVIAESKKGTDLMQRVVYEQISDRAEDVERDVYRRDVRLDEWAEEAKENVFCALWG